MAHSIQRQAASIMRVLRLEREPAGARTGVRGAIFVQITGEGVAEVTIASLNPIFCPLHRSHHDS